MPSSLFAMIMETPKYSNQNNVIRFSDNSRYLVSVFVYLCTLIYNLLFKQTQLLSILVQFEVSR